MERSTYLVALGSNRRHGRHGAPRRVIGAALEALAGEGLAVVRISRILDSAPLGPSRRRYANAAALIETGDPPPVLLTTLKRIEREFGRRSARRWGERVLDLDIVLWSGGAWAGPSLIIPHPAFRTRAFVLGPASRIAPGWRDPLTGRTVRQLARRLARAKPG